ncbi:hypothetical protein CFIO01_07125 [Colletotrichum fioriniae PJ7]|uniref:C2H2-type domain-containing protein n=1 Tax=Colletotrichum fioriniae PJ7 TaxID=1445577 RepID=A0A010QU34_9PEZI|nr:hypothetical protein CFIO01_07125 [Colletotrichum fioriniae PJ7]
MWVPSAAVRPRVLRSGAQLTTAISPFEAEHLNLIISPIPKLLIYLTFESDPFDPTPEHRLRIFWSRPQLTLPHCTDRACTQRATMSPAPPNKGKAPITDDGDLSDGSSQPSDAECVDAEAIFPQLQEGDKKPDPVGFAQPPSRSSLRATQEMQGEKSVKLERLSPDLKRGISTDSAAFDVEFAHSETGRESSSPLDLTMIKKKKKKKKVIDTGADELHAVYAAAPGEDTKNLLLDADRNVKSEFSKSDITIQLGQVSGHSSLERSRRMSEGDIEGSVSNAEDEPENQNEDPTKKVQRLMVDRIMSSFMSWLDIKKQVKQEEEEQESESQIEEALLEAAPGGDAADDALSESSPTMLASGSTSEMSSSRGHELESFMYRQVSAPGAPAPFTRHRNSNIALPPPPPPGSSMRPQIGMPKSIYSMASLEGPPPPVGRGSQISATYVPSSDSTVDFAGIPPLASAAQPPVSALISPQQVQSRSGYTARGASEVEEVSPFSKRSAAPASASRSFDSASLQQRYSTPLGSSAPSYREIASRQPPAEQAAGGTSKVTMHTGKRGRMANPSRKHDRSAGGRAPDEEDEGDENHLPRAKLSKVQEDAMVDAKLACPFFKHNPRKYKTRRPCCGPGWDQVHRIKPAREHIYRKHSLPKFSCPRCSQSFETQLALQAHARSLDACDVREPEFLDGITQDQEKKLRSRKKTSAKELTEAEKWTQVYRILFPDVREREIPSPYHNAEDAEMNLGGYEDYLRRELPPLVRRQLEKEVERELSFVEEGMKQKVIDIARNLQLTLFKGYQQLENQERGLQDTPSVDPSSSSETGTSFFTATDTSPSTMTTSGTTPEIPDPLDIFGDPAIPDFDFNFLADVPYPESQSPSKGQNMDSGFNQSFATQEPPTITPGMEMLGAQQHDLPYYGLDGYQDPNSQRIDASVLSYLP